MRVSKFVRASLSHRFVDLAAFSFKNSAVIQVCARLCSLDKFSFRRETWKSRRLSLRMNLAPQDRIVMTHVLASILSRSIQFCALALSLALGLTICAAKPVSAQTYTILYNFTGGVDGGVPNGNLIMDAHGNLYGSALGGGDLSCPPGDGYGCGVVFKVSPAGAESVLYAFASGTDGQYPDAGVIADAHGNLYGTTQYGGSLGHGEVFKLASTGTESVLYNFTGGNDGNFPIGVTLGSGGNLYGTTESGGSGGYGVLYKLSPGGGQTILHSFLRGAKDGSFPIGTPLVDTKGDVFGVTADGGASDTGMGYEYTSGTGKLIKLFFPGGTGLVNPNGGVTPDGHGNFYGASFFGDFGLGAIYEVSNSGKLTTFFSFDGTEGKVPTGNIVFDSAGNLYGIASGGDAGYGIVFELSPSGEETVLHQFSGTDGQLPNGGLVIDASGNIYGTTSAGGALGYGLVYKITP
jgi:uncharacterized repeat protein (TIGR03803 family)